MYDCICRTLSQLPNRSVIFFAVMKNYISKILWDLNICASICQQLSALISNLSQWNYAYKLYFNNVRLQPQTISYYIWLWPTNARMWNVFVRKKILTHQHMIASAEVKIDIDKSLENDNLERIWMLTLPFWIIVRVTKFLHLIFTWPRRNIKIQDDQRSQKWNFLFIIYNNGELCSVLMKTTHNV